MSQESIWTPTPEILSGVDDISLMRRARAIAGQLTGTGCPHVADLQARERIDGLILLNMAAGPADLNPFAFELEYIELMGCSYHLVIELVRCRLNQDSPIPIYDRLYGLNLPALMVQEIYAAVEHIWDLVVVLRLQEVASAECTTKIVEAHAARLVIRMCLQIDTQTELSEIEFVLAKLQQYTRGHLKRIQTSQSIAL